MPDDPENNIDEPIDLIPTGTIDLLPEKSFQTVSNRKWAIEQAIANNSVGNADAAHIITEATKFYHYVMETK